VAITITELSKITGVSRSTISRVLNRPHLVKQETRDRVLKALKDNNYVYNALAGGLTKRKTATIAVILPTITNPVFALSTKGIQDKAQKRGYSILLGSTNYSGKSEFKLLTLFHEKRIDGIVFTGTPLSKESIEMTSRFEIPYVITWEKSDEQGVSYVAFDNKKCGFNVTEYLISLGHRHIGMIAGKFSETSRASKRWLGYKEALSMNSINYDESIVIQKGYSVTNGKEAAGRLLRAPERPTAIVCANDILAIGAMAAAKEMGLKVGVDVSITGFDDLEVSEALNPSLTTFKIPAYRMGKIAAQVLIETIEGEINEPQQYLLEPSLVIRDSTGQAKEVE